MELKIQQGVRSRATRNMRLRGLCARVLTQEHGAAAVAAAAEIFLTFVSKLIAIPVSAFKIPDALRCTIHTLWLAFRIRAHIQLLPPSLSTVVAGALMVLQSDSLIETRGYHTAVELCAANEAK